MTNPNVPNFTGDDTVPLGDGNPPSESAPNANAPTSDRVGPGTGDGVDTRPLGDPNAPQGTGPEVPGQSLAAPENRPAPAGEVRVSHAESGDYSK